MNWEAIGAVGEIVSALAVVITLVYLAVQVGHARRAQRVEAIRSNRTERRDFFMGVRDSPYIPAIYAKIDRGELLDVEDETRLMHHNSALWGLIYSEWISNQMDLPGPFGTSQRANLDFGFGLPGFIDWFHEYGHRLYPKDFIAEILGEIERFENDSKTSK